MNPLPDLNPCPIWSSWALAHLPVGLLVLDSQTRVVFVNKWFLQHAGLMTEQVVNKPLFEVFPQLTDSKLEFFLNQSMTLGFPTVLSQTLHPSPFPLYQPGVQRTQDKFLRQSIRIIPVSGEAALSLGQRYTLIQISDVTQSVIRERLLKAQADKLKGMANLDVLTSLGNRRLLDESLPLAVRSAVKIGRPLSVIMFDIDFFKQFNDNYGHLAGDDCLQQVAQVLRDVCRRPHDVVARFGGEELVAVLPETSGKDAVQLAEAVLKGVQNLKIPHADSAAAVWVTLSAGVAAFDPCSAATSADLVGAADRALYAAKHQGRNRVCTAWGSTPT
ncbi:MAG: diguanylate cyclase [Rhodoferax sp.]|nr:diguanylate cyclase [Betaproteobacteria bacterium]NCN97558.1 diguanylate cyclase [Rhodoferax sp.]OIP19017.1 MAG: hypothetical protein AUK50_05235 [Comamonadaceae bacterium CG2_30_57_122]PIZ22378.1 MAG: diguanylate cyclase [Comamonadaceae bacterium CG_4_10_14_0_8_um_filter_57_29]PJC19162.1 MAG: diguanylate cyclase [Comamonadaceae bacterium CG_4_9_14_0_8_um_filter_57_21]